MMLYRYKESIAAYTKSLEIHKDKDPNAYINIATCYSDLEDYQQSIEFYLKAFNLNPSLLTVTNLSHEFGFTYVQMGEVKKARDVFERMIAGENKLKAQGYRSLALLLMYTGKYSEAINTLQEAILICKSRGYGLSELRNHLFLASAYKTKGIMTNYYEELDKVNELLKTQGMEPWWYFLYGKLLVRDRKIVKAERILNEISARINKGNKSDTSTFIILKGEIQLAKGNSSEGLNLIKTGVNFRSDGYTLESLANYYYDTGDLDMAITKYKEIIEIKNSIGWEPQEYWIKAHYNLGKLNEKKGLYEQAIIYYQDFINIWKEADEDLPELIDAKSRLTKLQELER